MNIDTERLINEVHLRPELWDLSCPLYKDRDAKIQAWRDVCQETMPEFDNLLISEQKNFEKQVQQRWKTARDAYVRCKATLKTPGSGGVKRKKYLFFNNMTFLDKKQELHTEDSILPNISIKKESPQFNETSENEGIFVSEPTLTESSVQPQTTTSNCRRSAFNRKRKFLRTPRKRNRSEDGFDRAKRAGSQVSGFDRDMMTFIKENAKFLQNDDMAFFCSLLPVTKTFSIEQKIMFRQEVLQKALEISRLSSDCPGTSNTVYSSASDS